MTAPATIAQPTDAVSPLPEAHARAPPRLTG